MHISSHTVKDIFNKAFNQKASKPFIIFRDSKITYGEFQASVRKFSTFFRNKSILIGDRVIFSSKNESFVCSFYLSLIANGITAVFIDPESGNERANTIINHCEAKFIFVDSNIQQNWNLAKSEERVLTIIQTFAKERLFHKLLNKNSKGTQLFPACVAELPESDISSEINPETDAYILYTSGTTSAPKGVRVSYRALFSHLSTLSNVYQLDEDSRLFNNLMLSHADGIIQGPMLALFNKATLFRPFPFSIQQIEDIFDIIYRENITHWVVVPTMIGLIYQFKQNDPDTLNNEYFKYIISCGGKLESILWQQFEDKFKVSIINTYGLTETVAGSLFAGPDVHSHVIGSIGKPVDCEVKIVDEDHCEKAIGEQGEIWIRGSLLMSGYLKGPEINKEVFDGEWLKTGDIGYKGKDGCFRITGRKKLVIITGGINVHPEEVTEVLYTHPTVQAAVTFGLDDQIWGEIVACAIVVKSQIAFSKEDIVMHCRKHLEENKVPKQIYFVNELPYGRSGKVMVQEIIERIAENIEQNLISSEIGPAFKNIVSQCFKIPADTISLDMYAENTQEWDSLSHLILIAEMEKYFNIEFSPMEVMSVSVLSDLYTIVNRKINK